MVFPAEFNLSSLDGTNGFVIKGINEGDYSGNSVSSAGDVNGDGIDDVIIGAYNADPNGTSGAGESYVVFGSDDGFAESIDLAALDGTNGFVIKGIGESDYSGTSVSSAGDVNGDGIDDVIIGADYADPNGTSNAGESYVVFGSDDGFAKSIDLAALDGTNGFVLKGIDEGDRSGYAVNSAGDVNNDGIDDLIIGAFEAAPDGNNYAGESYVVFGSNDGFAASFDLAALDGTNGFVLRGINEGDYSGFSVNSAGDVNGDGIDDLIIGGYGADPNGNNYAGESYVVFGSESGFDESIDLAALDGTNGFVIKGINEDDYSGFSVSSAGDVNGDGIDDVIIGAPLANPNDNNRAGESYIVFGSERGFDESIDLAVLDGTNGFVIKGIDEGDFSGVSVNSAGDVNGDGIDDLIIGAYGADTNGDNDNRVGESYVVFGSESGFDESIDLATLDGTNGFVLKGINEGDRSGFSVSGAGDVNGDGIDDVIIGAFTASPNGNYSAGESYVVFGVAEPLNLKGTNQKDTLTGAGGNDTIIGGNGKDRLLGKAGNDLLDGSNGKDILIGGLGDDTLIGGNGKDTFVLASGEGIDTIKDFDEDVIGLSGGIGFNDLSFAGNEIILSDTHEVLATLNGVETTDLTSRDFITV